MRVIKQHRNDSKNDCHNSGYEYVGNLSQYNVSKLCDVLTILSVGIYDKIIRLEWSLVVSAGGSQCT